MSLYTRYKGFYNNLVLTVIYYKLLCVVLCRFPKGIVTTWTSRKLDAMSRSHGDRRQVMPICAGCKSDRLGFSYMGMVSCAFLAVSYPLFQRWIQSASTMTGLRSIGV